MYEFCFINRLLKLTYFDPFLPSCTHRVPSVGSPERAIGCSRGFIECVSLYRRRELLLLINVEIFVELNPQIESVVYIILNEQHPTDLDVDGESLCVEYSGDLLLKF